MKNKHLIIISIFLFTLDVSSNNLINHIKIKSDKVEFIKNLRNVSFFSNVNINSSYVEISANSAIYDQIKEVISISGDPSSIKSNKNNNFLMEKQKPYFFSMKNLHLVEMPRLNSIISLSALI
ncbi:MAG: hypothetical protein CM15mP29_3860 [Alphaproteobacteria bacterium]|nr:MAG: hypothetical protein CM15mP29_3860 [Alphaproteobacteria bacterium]